MKILMISDFHFSNNTNYNEVIMIASKLCDIVNTELETEEELFIINLGDIINKGHIDGYLKADEIYALIEQNIRTNNKHYIFVPGNHDLVFIKDEDGKEINDSFENFDSFVKKHADQSYRYKSKNTFYIKYDLIDFITSNSVYKKDKKYASIDSAGLSNILRINKPNSPLFLTHHDIIGHMDDGTSFITNQSELWDIFNEYGIKYLLHGHTHISPEKYYRINDIITFGVGPAFEINDSDYPQFNILDYSNRKVLSCKNYVYNFPKNKYNEKTIYSLEIPKAIDYNNPQNRIERNVVEYSQTNSTLSLLFSEKKSLYELVNEKNHIVLLSEAGYGKSYELKSLAHMLTMHLRLLVKLKKQVRLLLFAKNMEIDFSKYRGVFMGKKYKKYRKKRTEQDWIDWYKKHPHNDDGYRHREGGLVYTNPWWFDDKKKRR